MSWIQYLSGMPGYIAILVVFAFCLIAVIRYLMKNVVDPFKLIVGNHLTHLMQEQEADREERAKMRDSLDRQTVAIQSQADAFHKICDRLEKDSP